MKIQQHARVTSVSLGKFLRMRGEINVFFIIKLIKKNWEEARRLNKKYGKPSIKSRVSLSLSSHFMYNRTKHNQGFFICSPLTRHHYIEAMPTLQKCMSTTNEWLSKGKSNEWIKFRAKNFLFCNLFINEGECFIRVSKHEKTDESTGHLLINICSSTVFFWKLIFKHTCLDILTRVFGYLITRVWICSLPDIKAKWGHTIG